MPCLNEAVGTRRDIRQNHICDSPDSRIWREWVSCKVEVKQGTKKLLVQKSAMEFLLDQYLIVISQWNKHLHLTHPIMTTTLSLKTAYGKDNK